MEEITKKKLQAIACKVRMGVIEGTYCAKSGHPGGSLSISDLLTYLYFAKMHIDPKQPEMADRDRLVLSKGHCVCNTGTAWFLPTGRIAVFAAHRCNVAGSPVHSYTGH